MYLANATEIDEFAQRLDARPLLPELIRRLVLETGRNGLVHVDFPAGEGIAKHGYDGIVDTTVATAFIPEGRSVWELGTSGDPAAKAGQDIANRTKSEPAEKRAELAYVAVTARRYDKARVWAETQTKKGEWKSVDFLDADRLETWLHAAARTHLWLTENIKHAPPGATTLTAAWAKLSRQGAPYVTAPSLTVGRDEQVEKVVTFAKGDAAAIAIAAAAPQETLGFIASALGEAIERAVVISSQEAWTHFASSNAPSILIAHVGDIDTAMAVERGHHVIVVENEAISGGRSSDRIELPRPNRMQLSEVFQRAGAPSDKTFELAGIARRSFPAFLRVVSKDPSILAPSWANASTSETLTWACLIGSWSEAETGDGELVEALTGDRTGFQRHLRELRLATDPPIRLHHNVWYVSSKEDLWRLVASKHIVRDDLKRYCDAAIEVLKELDPKRDLPPEEQYAAAVHGKVRRWSGKLRDAIADTLAFLGSLDPSDTTSDGAQIGSIVRGAVRQLLRWANEGETVDRWASLADVLPLLAEAAPDEFLSACLEATGGERPLFASLFEDHGQASVLFMPFSPHIAVCTALERLGWDADLLPTTVAVLARMERLDPGGKWANRPARSLEHIFRQAFPWTDATHAQRAEILDDLVRTEPDVAWKILSEMCLDNHGTWEIASGARWRNWGDNNREVRRDPEYDAQLLDRTLELAKQSWSRTRKVIDRLATLPDARQREVLNHVIGHPPELHVAEREALLAELREFQYFERMRRGDAASDVIALAVRACEAIPTDDAVDGCAWLFDRWPRLATHTPADGQEYYDEIDRLRRDALRELEGDPDKVADLIDRAGDPQTVGRIMRQLDAEGDAATATLAADLLGREEERQRHVAIGYVSAMVDPDNPAETVTTMLATSQLSDRAIATLFMSVHVTGDLLDLLAQQSEGAQDIYWRELDVRYALNESTDPAIVVDRLIGAERPEAAVDYVSFRQHGKKATVEPSVALRALNALLDANNPEVFRRGFQLDYEVETLIRQLGNNPDVSDDELVRLEFNFLPWLKDRGTGEPAQPLRLHRQLSQNPTVFVDAICSVYRSEDDDERAEVTEEGQLLARALWDLLDSWTLVPGTDVSGGIDKEALTAWVTEARSLLAENRRTGIGDDQIGRILAHAPRGDDGCWPCEPVRDVIETVASQELDEGFEIGRRNQRGVTSRAVWEGGGQELKLVEEYEQYARLATRWPRTRAILKSIADAYRWEATRIDADAQLGEDTE